MATLTLQDERLISGKGVLKVPAGVFQDRYYILYLDVVRRPKNEYRSFEWNPPQSVYARFVYRKDGYVQNADIMRYQREERTYVNDITGQNLRAIKCAYEGTLESFNRLSAALGLVVLPYTNLILEYKSLSLGWDEILFQCYADTAIQCRFYSLDYDVCNPANDQTDLPPPPPPPLPPVPPGTPIGSISPPYDDDDDGGNTVPFPGDESEEPPPVIEPCSKLLVTVRVTFQSGLTVNAVGVGSSGGLQYAPVVEAFVQTSGSTSQALVKGGAAVGSAACNGLTNYNILYSQTFNPSNPITDAEIIDIQVIP
jgi:hypothetical protein